MRDQEKTQITRRQFLKSSFILGAVTLLPPFEASATSSGRKIKIISGLKNPYGIALDHNGYIYVSDSGNYCIKKFSPEGSLVQTIGKPGSKETCLNFPQGVQVDMNGDIYVMDSNNGRIAIFSAPGHYIGSIGTIGGYPGAFYTPKGLYLHTDNKIYVANTRNHTIYIFDKNTHQLLSTYGSLGEDDPNLQQGGFNYRFRLPTNVAVAPNGNLYVVDSKHGMIKALDNNGRFLFKFGAAGTKNGQFNFPEGIALDSNQNVFVCDSLNNRIQKFTADGQFLDKIEQGFAKPAGICIDSDDTIYVVDAGNQAIKIFQWL